MQKITSILLSAIVIVLSSVAASANDFSYDPKSIQKLSYEIAVTITSTQDVFSTEQARQKSPESFNMEMAVGYTQTTLPTSTAGKIAVINSFDFLRVKGEKGEQIFVSRDTIASDKSIASNPISRILDVTFNTEFDSKGNITKYEGIENIQKILPTTDLKMILSLNIIPFPDKAIAPGDTWQTPLPEYYNPANGITDTEGQLLFTLKEIRDTPAGQVAVISLNYERDLSSEMSKTYEEMGMKNNDVKKTTVAFTGEIECDMSTKMASKADYVVKYYSLSYMNFPAEEGTTTMGTEIDLTANFALKMKSGHR